ncbi:hypothetical protein [Sutcliffiella horikoshii]|uniref:hypothetical protein n=1 Tax=Sutcliffiella horikoshii TaxID=79883 RepID=UPI003CF27D44
MIHKKNGIDNVVKYGDGDAGQTSAFFVRRRWMWIGRVMIMLMSSYIHRICNIINISTIMQLQAGDLVEIFFTSTSRGIIVDAGDGSSTRFEAVGF